MVTQGAQEAMVVLLLGLFDPAVDVLLASDPTYIGITGLAAIAGIETLPVASDEQGLELGALRAAIAAARARGKRPRAFYHVPDFNNPLGTRMPLEDRRRLLALLRDEEVLLFEDNAYGMFVFDGEPLPTLKALDRDGVVIYLGSFSKTLYPGLRLGYLVAGQEVAGPDGKKVPLAVELSKVKSLTTVTTSPLLQAVAGAILLENDCSLRRVVAAKLPFYRGNRDRMLGCLEKELGPVAGVSWNRPAGGFFLTVSLPFAFGAAEVEACAGGHGVIVCPMSYFALSPGREKQVRLSFSYVDRAADRGGHRPLREFRAGAGGVSDHQASRPASWPPSPPGALIARGLSEEHAALRGRRARRSLAARHRHPRPAPPADLPGRARRRPQLGAAGLRLVGRPAGRPPARRRQRPRPGSRPDRRRRSCAPRAGERQRRGIGPQFEPFRSRLGLHPGDRPRRPARTGVFEQRRAGRPGHQGRRPLFGTNPISMAVAGEGGEIFCADFATSQVSYSRVKAHRAQGKHLEPGWVVGGEAGEPLALLPLGGHKGQCLGMMVEILCALIAGMPFDHQLSHLYDPPFGQPRQVAHLFLALDPEAFGAAAAFPPKPRPPARRRPRRAGPGRRKGPGARRPRKRIGRRPAGRRHPAQRSRTDLLRPPRRGDPHPRPSPFRRGGKTLRGG